MVLWMHENQSICYYASHCLLSTHWQSHERLRRLHCSRSCTGMQSVVSTVCKMCGRTQIRKNIWDPRTDADGSPPNIRGCGLTRIINSSSALGKLTRWAPWADAIDVLYLSHPRNHALQLQPLIVFQWPSLLSSDGLDTRLWLRACVGSGECRL